MIAPHEPAPPRRFPLLRAAVRWLVAGGVGALASLSILVLMVWFIHSTRLVDRLFRVFPLTRTELSPDEMCDDTPLRRAVTIEGVVGTLRAGRVQPLADAVVVSDDSDSGARPVEVSSEGVFRFVAAFPYDQPSACGTAARAAGRPALHLIVGAPGCGERRVPVTRAWVPHAVLLECAPAAQAGRR